MNKWELTVVLTRAKPKVDQLLIRSCSSNIMYWIYKMVCTGVRTVRRQTTRQNKSLFTCWINWAPGGSVVTTSDCHLEGPEFESHPGSGCEQATNSTLLTALAALVARNSGIEIIVEKKVSCIFSNSGIVLHLQTI